MASVVVAPPPDPDALEVAIEDGAIELDAIEDGAMELDAMEDGAMELGAIELGATDAGVDPPAAALLDVLDEPAAVVLLLELHAPVARASTANPATRPVRFSTLFLAEPGMVETRTSSS